MPTCVPRQIDNCSSFMAWMGVPFTYTSPLVGWSIPVIMFNSVDLPLPDGPTMARNSPRMACSDTPFKTLTFHGNACKRCSNKRRFYWGTTRTCPRMTKSLFF